MRKELKKTLEWVLVTSPIWLGVGAQTIAYIIEKNNYNSLSRQEKIEYLERGLNNGNNYPPIFAGTRGGAAVLATWGEHKKYIINELERLKSNP